MYKRLLLAFALLALFGIPTMSAGTTNSFPYTTAGYSLIPIWCQEGGHAYAPKGSPDEYESVEGWAFSGEPECAAGDLAFGNSEHGWAGGAFEVTGFLGGHLIITLDDDLTENPPIWTDVSGYTCGSQSMVIPSDLEPHHQTPTSAPQYFQFFYVDSAMVVGDDNELCLASTGTATGTVSA